MNKLNDKLEILRKLIKSNFIFFIVPILGITLFVPLILSIYYEIQSYQELLNDPKIILSIIVTGLLSSSLMFVIFLVFLSDKKNKKAKNRMKKYYSEIKELNNKNKDYLLFLYKFFRSSGPYSFDGTIYLDDYEKKDIIENYEILIKDLIDKNILINNKEKIFIEPSFRNAIDYFFKENIIQYYSFENKRLIFNKFHW